MMRNIATPAVNAAYGDSTNPVIPKPRPMTIEATIHVSRTTTTVVTICITAKVADEQL